MAYNKTAGIYIHFPFCSVKCGFCDFYSLEQGYGGNYFRSIIDELELYQASGALKSKELTTLYLGGGTPSLAVSKDIELFFEYLKRNGYLRMVQEITLEANPENITREKLELYRHLGINRISLGVQSLNQGILTTLGRAASLEKTINAIMLIKEYFDNYSLDLMYGIQGQDLCQELFSFGTIHPPHFSTYMFSLEKTVPFYSQRGSFLKSEDHVAQEYKDLNQFMITAGYKHYEISSFALEGKESFHNQHYWQGREYLGLGAGASGYINNIRYTNMHIHEYIESLNKRVFPYAVEEEINAVDKLMEDVMLKSRLSYPFSIKEHLMLLENQVVDRIDSFFNQLNKEDYLDYDDRTKTIMPQFRTWIFLDWILKGFFRLLQEQGIDNAKT